MQFCEELYSQHYSMCKAQTSSSLGVAGMNAKKARGCIRLLKYVNFTILRALLPRLAWRTAARTRWAKIHAPNDSL